MGQPLDRSLEELSVHFEKTEAIEKSHLMNPPRGRNIAPPETKQRCNKRGKTDHKDVIKNKSALWCNRHVGIDVQTPHEANLVGLDVEIIALLIRAQIHIEIAQVAQTPAPLIEANMTINPPATNSA